MKATTLLLVAAIVAAPHATSAQDAPPVPLHLAALQGNVDAVRQHVAAGADLDARDAYGSTPLIIAATFGRPAVAHELIAGGADLSAPNREGATPLHIAAFLCRTEIVRELLRAGADRDLRNRDGSTALDGVEAPFEAVRPVYDQIGAGLAPLGLTLDYDRIRAERPVVADLLRHEALSYEPVSFAPVVRDDWPVSTPESEGVDPGLLADLYARAGALETSYSLLVVKNGRLIAEQYFHDGAIDSTSLVQSVTKSYFSALVGLALERGCIQSLDQTLADIFPEYLADATDPRKRTITIRQMLQMRSGYPWEESTPTLWDRYLGTGGDNAPLFEEFALVDDPGTAFHYSNFSSWALGAAVSRTCATDLKAFAKRHLLDPIGSGTGVWWRDPHGFYHSLLSFTPRDLARFGLLYLNDGRWGGRQVLPESWVRASLESYSEDAWHLPVGPNMQHMGYGYQWWSAQAGDRRFPFAWGHGGQVIALIDDLDMVIVFTADPLWLRHGGEPWSIEKRNLNLVGDFVAALPLR